MFFILHLQPVICRSIHTEGRFLATVLLCDGARKKDMVAEGRGGGGRRGEREKLQNRFEKQGGETRGKSQDPFLPPTLTQILSQLKIFHSITHF